MNTLPHPGTPVIGHSLSMCLRSLVKGDVAIDDVIRIETSATFDGPDQMDQMIQQSMQSKHLPRYREMAQQLQVNGKIVQKADLATKIADSGIWSVAA